LTTPDVHAIKSPWGSGGQSFGNGRRKAAANCLGAIMVGCNSAEPPRTSASEKHQYLQMVVLASQSTSAGAAASPVLLSHWRSQQLRFTPRAG
jgi:hypothetical protein